MYLSTAMRSILRRSITAGLGATVGALTAIATLPVPAHATPAFARRTGLPCSRCHINPAGGGRRTAFGTAFEANGFRLPGHHRRNRGSHGSNYRLSLATATVLE
jgi:hypothetical protein